MKNQQTINSERENVQKKFNTARSNLLLMIAFTLINIVLLVLETNTMLLFSATVPYFAVALGIASEMNSFLIGSICFAAILLLIYLLCWIFSKKHYGWMIAALALFILDSLFMVGIYAFAGDFSGILDVIIHIWVLYYLIIGVKYGYRLKTLPEETKTSFETNDFNEEI